MLSIVFLATRVINKISGALELGLGDIAEDLAEALAAISKTEQKTHNFKTALDTRVIEKKMRIISRLEH